MFKLDRQELLKAISFLKPAIMESKQPNSLEYVHVKTMGEECQLTAANGFLGKRLTLLKPQQLEFEEPVSQKDMKFMIDKPILEAYEKLLQKHKTAFSKAVKSDHTLNYIDISPEVLGSHKDIFRYNQTKFTYPDIDKFFVEGKFKLDHLRFNPEFVIDTLKGFPGIVHVSFEEHEKHPNIPQRVYMQIETGEYQAFFMPAVSKESLKNE